VSTLAVFLLGFACGIIAAGLLVAALCLWMVSDDGYRWH